MTKAKIDGLVRGECEPYTQNDEYFLAYKTRMLTRYKIIHQELQGKANLVTALRAFNPSNSSSTGNSSQWTYLNNAISNLSSFGIQIKAEDFVMLLPQHDLTPALDIMAEVRAYFQGKLHVNQIYVSADDRVFSKLSGVQALWRQCPKVNRR